jgi:3-hydroxyisobutyrate dehydrogenase-like beta-hydroxyacid dehydrogenase
VTGRPAVAAGGNLNLLVAGPAKAIQTVTPVLEKAGKRIWPLGDVPRRANVVKVAINYNLLHAIQSIGESIALVERQGVDPEEFVEVLTNTLFGGVAYTGYGREIATRDYDPPGFGIDLAIKDLGLAEEVAAEGGLTLFTADALRAVFERAFADPDLARLDWGAVAEVSRRHQN